MAPSGPLFVPSAGGCFLRPAGEKDPPAQSPRFSARRDGVFAHTACSVLLSNPAFFFFPHNFFPFPWTGFFSEDFFRECGRDLMFRAVFPLQNIGRPYAKLRPPSSPPPLIKGARRHRVLSPPKIHRSFLPDFFRPRSFLPQPSDACYRLTPHFE